MTLHSKFTGVQVHKPFAWEYADEAARLADVTHVGADVGKLAIQTDINGVFMLVDWETPTPTWVFYGTIPAP